MVLLVPPVGTAFAAPFCPWKIPSSPLPPTALRHIEIAVEDLDTPPVIILDVSGMAAIGGLWISRIPCVRRIRTATVASVGLDQRKPRP